MPRNPLKLIASLSMAIAALTAPEVVFALTNRRDEKESYLAPDFPPTNPGNEQIEQVDIEIDHSDFIEIIRTKGLNLIAELNKVESNKNAAQPYTPPTTLTAHDISLNLTNRLDEKEPLSTSCPILNHGTNQEGREIKTIEEITNNFHYDYDFSLRDKPNLKNEKPIIRDSLKKGMEFYKQKKYDQAIKKFTEAIKSKPNMASNTILLYLFRAECYLFLQQPNKSFDDLYFLSNLILKLPDNNLIHARIVCRIDVLKSFAHTSLSQYDLALDILEKALSRTNYLSKADMINLYLRVAEAYLLQGKNPLVNEALIKIIDLDPDLQLSHTPALEKLRLNLLAEQNIKVEVYLAKALEYIKIKNYKKAIIENTKGIALNVHEHRKIDFYINQGHAYLALKEYRAAVENLLKALDVYAKLPNKDTNKIVAIHDGISDCYLALGNNDLADDLLSKAVNINPIDPLLDSEKSRLNLLDKLKSKNATQEKPVNRLSDWWIAALSIGGLIFVYKACKKIIVRTTKKQIVEEQAKQKIATELKFRQKKAEKQQPLAKALAEREPIKIAASEQETVRNQALESVKQEDVKRDAAEQVKQKTDEKRASDEKIINSQKKAFQELLFQGREIYQDLNESIRPYKDVLMKCDLYKYVKNKNALLDFEKLNIEPNVERFLDESACAELLHITISLHALKKELIPVLAEAAVRQEEIQKKLEEAESAKKTIEDSVAAAAKKEAYEREALQHKQKQVEEAKRIFDKSLALDAKIKSNEAAKLAKQQKEFDEVIRSLMQDLQHESSFNNQTLGDLDGLQLQLLGNMKTISDVKLIAGHRDPWLAWDKFFSLLTHLINYAAISSVILHRKLIHEEQLHVGDQNPAVKDALIAWTSLRHSLKHVKYDNQQRFFAFLDKLYLKITTNNKPERLIQVATWIKKESFFQEIKAKLKPEAMRDEDYLKWVNQKMIPIMNGCCANLTAIKSKGTAVQMDLTLEYSALKAIIVYAVEPFNEARQKRMQQHSALLTAIREARKLVYGKVGHELSSSQDQALLWVLYEKFMAINSKMVNPEAVDFSMSTSMDQKPQQNRGAYSAASLVHTVFGGLSAAAGRPQAESTSVAGGATPAIYTVKPN